MADPQSDSRTGLVLAWATHAFTALGVVLAMGALIAVQQHRWTDAMLWLLVALVVDGVDGTLARATRVAERVPRIDGDALDLVVDYLTYVLVPALFLLEAGILAGPMALPLAAAILVSALYVFARRDMKTADGYFRGFPALWNIVALYLFAAGISGLAAAAVVAVLIILTFAPIHVVHPFRSRDWKPWPLLLSILWLATTLALLLPLGSPALTTAAFVTSAASAIALIALGLLRTWRGPVSAPQGG